MKDKEEAKTKRYKIVVDRDACIGAGTCVEVANKTFALDDEQKAYLLEGVYDDDDMILLAAQACPVLAIFIYDADSGKQIWPVMGLS